MMLIPKSPRYRRVHKAVEEFLELEDITEFPIDPFKIIQDNNWGLISYSELSAKHNITLEEVINGFQTKDGFIEFGPSSGYSIAYNDKIGSPGRIRFTLMHEIGHIYMKHLIDFDQTLMTRGSLSKEEYKVLEEEANVFARNALAPAVVIHTLSVDNKKEIKKVFSLSDKAAEVRLKSVNNDLRGIATSGYHFFKNKFQKFVNLILHGKTCTNCKHFFSFHSAKYCPICGYQDFIKGDVNKLRYFSFQFDSNNRPTECPRCENENINSQGDFCKICGLNIVNKCTDTLKYSDTGFQYTQESCGEYLEGDARFCNECGNSSTYFLQGLLPSWEDEINQNGNRTTNLKVVKSSANSQQVAATVDSSDEDLPF
jgi:rRNA maturation endonuclease Nob1